MLLRTTKKWLSKHDCTVIGFWGENPPDLLEVLNIYSDDILEGGDGRNAIENVYSEIYEDIEITHFHGEFGLFNKPGFQHFNDCKHKAVFLRDEQIPFPEEEY